MHTICDRHSPYVVGIVFLFTLTRLLVYSFIRIHDDKPEQKNNTNGQRIFFVNINITLFYCPYDDFLKVYNKNGAVDISSTD